MCSIHLVLDGQTVKQVFFGNYSKFMGAVHCFMSLEMQQQFAILLAGALNIFSLLSLLAASLS